MGKRLREKERRFRWFPADTKVIGWSNQRAMTLLLQASPALQDLVLAEYEG
jgi:hypothetical protein